jgi:hypothetical protein
MVSVIAPSVPPAQVTVSETVYVVLADECQPFPLSVFGAGAEQVEEVPAVVLLFTNPAEGVPVWLMVIALVEETPFEPAETLGALILPAAVTMPLYVTLNSFVPPRLLNTSNKSLVWPDVAGPIITLFAVTVPEWEIS